MSLIRQSWMVIITLVFLHTGSIAFGQTSRPAEESAMAEKTEVVVIGTIHFQHHKSALYKPEVLKEIIVAVKPAAILNELPLSEVDADGRPKGRTYQNPEGWAADQAATELKAEQVPFDRPDRQEFYARTKYFSRQQRLSKQFQKWWRRMQDQDPNHPVLRMVVPLLQDIGRAQGEIMLKEPPRVINSAAFDAMIRAKHVLGKELIPDLLRQSPELEAAAEDARFLADEWRERNQIMAANIVKAAKAQAGKRIVVITGCEHRYILRDLLKGESRIRLREYWELADIDPRSVPVSAARREWEKGKREQLEQGARTCREFWLARIRGDWARASELRPSRTAAQWQAATAKNPPVELLEVGPSRWPEPRDGTVLVITPCTVRFADGKALEIRMLTKAEYRDGKTRYYIPCTLGEAREVDGKAQRPSRK